MSEQHQTPMAYASVPPADGTRRRRTARTVERWVAPLLAGVLLIGVGATTAWAFTAQPPADAGGVFISGCVIRLNASGPSIHQNTAHACLGVESVGLNSAGDLRIVNRPGGPIMSCTAAIDETMALRGVIAGCSGGSGVSTIRFYDTDRGMRVRATSKYLASDVTNVWMTWIAAKRA